MLLICLKTIGVLILAGAGAVLGLQASRWRKPWWLVAYLLPLALILAIVLARRLPRLEFVAPTAWLMAGRTEFIAFGFAVPVLFGTLIPRLRRKRERLLLWVLVCTYVIAQSALPFLLPAFSQGSLAAINRRFSEQGVRAECCWFASIGDLRGKEPVMAAVRYRFLIDHFVTVLSVTDSEVVIGDPLIGREELSYDEFSDRWRRYGIVLARRGYPRDTNPHARRPGQRAWPDEKLMCCLK